MNAKDVAHVYGISRNMLLNLMRDHKQELDKRATRYRNLKGSISRCRDFNPKQLSYIVEEIMGYVPDGYIFSGNLLKKEKL